jgi:hypothetical protein
MGMQVAAVPFRSGADFFAEIETAKPVFKHGFRLQTEVPI